MKNVVYSLIYAILKDRHLAEDITHNVFIKVHKSASSYKKGTSPKAWIIQIARNSAIDELRKNKVTFTDIEENQNIPDLINDFDDKIIVTNAINTLEFEHRQIIILHIVAGLTFKEISKILDKPLGTITWQYRNSLTKLKKILS